MSNYISTSEALRVLPMMKRKTLLKHAKKNWDGKCIKNKWYWNKDDVCYPKWEVSEWQNTFVLPFLAGLTDDEKERLTYYDVLHVLQEFFPHDYKIITQDGSSTPAMFLFNSINGMVNITYRDGDGKWNNITEKIHSTRYENVMSYVQLMLVTLENGEEQ